MAYVVVHVRHRTVGYVLVVLHSDLRCRTSDGRCCTHVRYFMLIIACDIVCFDLHRIFWIHIVCDVAYDIYPHKSSQALNIPAIRTTAKLQARGPSSRSRWTRLIPSDYPHKIGQIQDSLAIRTGFCRPTKALNWTLQLSAPEFPSNWTFYISNHMSKGPQQCAVGGGKCSPIRMKWSRRLLRTRGLQKKPWRVDFLIFGWI